MKGLMCKGFVWVFFGLAFLVFGFSAWGDDTQRCIVCGMDNMQYPHSRYVVTTTDGKTYVTCGVQCGLTLHLRLKEKWESATATDLLSNRSFDARKGFYVFQSSVITDMSPGFIAFKKRVDADKFAKGFGGQVVSYDEALGMWQNHMN